MDFFETAGLKCMIGNVCVCDTLSCADDVGAIGGVGAQLSARADFTGLGPRFLPCSFAFVHFLPTANQLTEQ